MTHKKRARRPHSSWVWSAPELQRFNCPRECLRRKAKTLKERRYSKVGTHAWAFRLKIKEKNNRQSTISWRWGEAIHSVFPSFLKLVLRDCGMDLCLDGNYLACSPPQLWESILLARMWPRKIHSQKKNLWRRTFFFEMVQWSWIYQADELVLCEDYSVRTDMHRIAYGLVVT